MRRLFFAITICLILVLAGCTQQQEQKKEPLKISLNVWPGYAYAFIAKEKGFFEDNGVEVDLMLSEDYSESLGIYSKGKSDAIFEVYSDAIFQVAEQKIPSKVVYVVDYSYSGDVIIGKSELKSVSDLKGKRIGIGGPNSFSHMFVLLALQSNNLTESDVYFVDVPAEKVLEYLEADKIDAGHTWEPTYSQALAKGYVKIAKAGDYPGSITDVLVFNSGVINSRRSDVQAVVNSLVQARKFVASNRKEALEIMAKAEGVSLQDMESGIDAIVLLDLDENRYAMKKNGEISSLYSSGQFISNFYLDRGQISIMPVLDNIIDSSFISNAGK